MDAIRRIATTVIPAPARRVANRAVRGAVLRFAMRQFLRDPDTALGDDRLLALLVFGWGNPSWSARNDYLRACLEQARASEQPILDCGSGLSTLLLGAIAQRHGNRVWSLEHEPKWAHRTQSALSAFGIRSVSLCTAPLRSYGAFSWYDPPLADMPERFSMVVCDGPPGQTPGGRYGLVPVMGTRLAHGCVILLDDARRAHERDTADRWAADLHASCEILSTAQPFVRLVVGAQPAGGR